MNALETLATYLANGPLGDAIECQAQKLAALCPTGSPEIAEATFELMDLIDDAMESAPVDLIEQARPIETSRRRGVSFLLARHFESNAARILASARKRMPEGWRFGG